MLLPILCVASKASSLSAKSWTMRSDKDGGLNEWRNPKSFHSNCFHGFCRIYLRMPFKARGTPPPNCLRVFPSIAMRRVWLTPLHRCKTSFFVLPPKKNRAKCSHQKRWTVLIRDAHALNFRLNGFHRAEGGNHSPSKEEAGHPNL